LGTGINLVSDTALFTPIRIRFDSSEIEEERWGLRHPNVATSVDPRRFVSRLLKSPLLQVEMRPVGGVPRGAQFDASDLASLMPELEGCTGSAVARGSVFEESVLDQRPALLSSSRPLVYPDSLKRAGVEGRVLVQAIIDPAGHIEPESVTILQSLHPVLDQAAKDYMLAAVFQPGRIGGRAVRVLVVLPFDFKPHP
jgi:TonB family protein